LAAAGGANLPTAISQGRKKMNVGEWLRRLDLGRYEEAFRDNEIDERSCRG
jgi:SAM (Sterile alpha motif) domain-containing protein